MNQKLSDFEREIVGERGGGGGGHLKFSSERFLCSVLYCSFFDLIFGWVMKRRYKLCFGC